MMMSRPVFRPNGNLWRMCCVVFAVWLLVLTHTSLADGDFMSQFKIEENDSDSEKKVSPPKIMACYYSQKDMNETKIPADLCTHLIFSAVDAGPNGIEVRSPTQINSWRLLNKLKQKNPNLKVMVSIAGKFESVVGQGTKVLQSFINGTNQTLHKYNIDGIDLDWEFPGILWKYEFYYFQKALYELLNPQGKILSGALPHGFLVFVESYYASAINSFFEFVTVMTYDYSVYTPRHPYTGYNSPLKPAALVINRMKKFGVLPSKLLLGYATYGRSWKLADPKNHGLHAKAVGYGAPGPFTNTTGYYLMSDVCVAVMKGGSIVKDEVNGAEYLYYGDTWVSFNGLYSADLEAEWVRTNGFRGVGIWAVEFGDYGNVCDLGKFPVLNMIKKVLSNLL